MKFILIPFAILGIVVIGALIIAVIETNYHKRKGKKKREIDKPNEYSKEHLKFMRGRKCYLHEDLFSEDLFRNQN